ncbi:TonB-dependent receptor [Pseudoxanthomonas broegbernensis]|uniref:TonB-dependent receptor n=1 Tax=Pseudoxanthomonas broegbernensis TaxID=83619 RepID=A0A7V8GMR5_9GAMM|nr:TonB-dependent hemoglobin/transferrin/lactoferrin family receptor [Pseudoxanthomonas broegbernensis]KAF1686638.1 TonB-dependent receptor [Pseudoxanthomonas broegbernensis]MBB6063606.1 hemoglobin/transferrin/lactoferrin receptor protein [Pseudoxanthomonas broegbernensis]
MKTSHTLLALAIGAGLAAAAHAEPAATAATDGASTLDAIQVHGEREKARSANQNVTVLGARQLEDEMAQSMEDLTRYIPGVSIADLGRFGDNGFNIRGIEGDRVAMTIDGLSMAEGLETARSYEFFRAGRGGVDIDSLKSVEVVKGADSIGAGSGALGGAVMFTTKDPADYLKAQGNDTYGSLKLGYTGYNEEKLGSFTLANRSGIVESMLVYTRRKAHEAEAWYDSTEAQIGSARRLPDPIDHDSTNVLGKIDFVIGQAHRLGVVYERNRVENLVENLTRVAPPSYMERWGEDSNDRDRYGLRYTWSAGNAAFDTLEAKIDRQETESRGITRVLTGSGTSANPTPTPGTTPCTPALPCDRAEDRSTGQVLDRVALDFDKRAGAHALAYGAAWQQRDIDFTAIDYRWNNAGELDTATIDPAQVPGTEATSWNLYLRDRIALHDDRVRLTLGLRYDRYDYSPRLSETFGDDTGTVRDVSFSAPSGQVGISYEFLPSQSLWFQAGRGFRAPTTGEMYAPTSTAIIDEVATGNAVEVPTSAANPDLEAETSLNLELGYRWESENARLGVSVFRDRYEDFIESVRLTANPGTEYRTCTRGVCTTRLGYDYNTLANVGQVTVKGVELEGLWRLGEAWLLRAVASHSQGEQKDGSPLDSINPDRGLLGLSWQGLDNRLRITGNLTHALAKKRGDVHIEPDVFGAVAEPFLSEAYTVADLFGSFQFNERLRVNAGVYNLFDEKYYQWARIRNVTRGDFYLYGYATDEGIGRYSEPGRNFRVSLSWAF